MFSITGRYSILFFHDIGQNPILWKRLLNSLNLPNTNIITPAANKIDVSYRGLGFQMAWFNFNGTNNQLFEEFDSEGIKRAQTYVHKLIREEIKKNIPSNNIIIGGFSQGGALALYAGLTFPEKLAAIIAISSWLPFYSKFSKSWVTHNHNIPIFIAHGRKDKMIPPIFSRYIIKTLKPITTNITYKLYDEVYHGTSTVETVEMCEFIEMFYPKKQN